MTKIKIYKNSLNKIIGYELSGHTGYGEFGQDVLCASLSTITQSIAMGLRDVLLIDVDIIRRDKDGYIKVELPHVLDQEKIDKAQILLETLLVSVQDLQEGYSSYISMEVIENVY